MFIKHYLVLLIVFFSISALFSASNMSKDSLTVPIYAYFNKGESQRYEITQGKMNYVGERPTDSSESKRTITLTAIDSTTEGYVMEVLDESYKQTISKSAVFDKTMNSSEMQAINAKFSNFRLRFRITPDGLFMGYDNMDSLVLMTKEIYSLLQKNKKIAGKELQKLNDELGKLYTSPGVVRDKQGLPFQLMFGFHGYTYDADTSLTYESSFPNNIEPDGKPIPSNVTVYFSYVEDDSAFVNVEQVAEPDEDFTSDLMKKWMKKAIPRDKHSTFENMRMAISDVINAEIHQSSGWLTYLSKKRVLTISKIDNEEDTTVVEYLEINLISDTDAEKKKD